MTHNPDNGKCPLNDSESYAPPVFGNVTCNCPPKPPPSVMAYHIAARTWCDLEMSHVTMDIEAATKIAYILDDVMKEQRTDA